MTAPGGGDVNIGRAHGEISITADTRGAQEAQAAMAATSAEAEVLDRRMGVVNQRFEENRRTSIQTAEQIMKQRQQLEDLRVSHERYSAEYAKATERSTRAQREFTEEFEKQEPNQRKLLQLSKEAERAKEQEERLLLRVTDAHTRYERKLNDVNTALSAFNRHHIEATTGLRRMSVEADRLGESLERVSDKLGSVLRIVGQGGLMGLFGLGSAGTMAAMGAGGLGQVTSALSGMVIAMQQLSGIVALIPAGVGGAAISLGTLATAFHGVKEAMGSMNDPQKFIESLRELAPAARMAMLTFYSFQDAIRGVRFAIQEATFEPFVQQLQPLIYTWLPLLQEAGKQVGRAFGGMISQIMSFMQTTSAQQAFTTFVNNMVSGLQAASHAIEPLMSAIQTLSVVGSGFFERIGVAITKVANEFNNWVQAAAQSGRLQAWIDSALRAFTDLGHIVMNVGETIMNIAAIGSTHGGGFLEWLSDVTSRIRAWTESADGMQKMANFFDLLHQAGQAMTPILHLMGQALATVGGAFTRLGIEIAPAVTQFFQSIVESLHTLAPILLQMGPSISTFLVQFGQALAQLVQQAGPQLPGLFQSFTQALLLLLPVVTRVLEEVVKFVSHFTPKEIEGIILAAVAIRGLSAGFSLLASVLSAGPWGVAAAAIALIGVALYEAYQHSQTFRDAVNGLVDFLKSIPGEIASAWESLGSVLSNTVDKWVASALSWGSKLAHAFADGIRSGLDFVSDAWDAIQGKTKDKSPTSRAKEGPWSTISPEEAGAKLSTDYARGMASGTPAVSAAASGIAAGAAGGVSGGGGTGTTGMGFTSAGGIGASGSGTSFGSDIGVGRGIGASGFDQYVDFLTKDLSTWSGILQGGFNLIKDTITNVAIPGIKLFADFWQGGNNPLTQPGGLFGPQELAGQWGMPGVENVKAPGHAPDDWARKFAANQATPGQQTPPGVTPVGPRGQARTGPGANNPPPNNQPPPGPGSAGAGGGAPAPPPASGPAAPLPPPAPGTAGVPAGPGAVPNATAAGNVGNINVGNKTPQDIANAIATEGRRRGLSDDQIHAALAIGQDESGLQALGFNSSGGNASVGGVGGVYQQSSQAQWGTNEQIMDPRYGISKFMDIYQENLRRFPGISPLNAAILTQNPQLVQNYGIAPNDLTTGSQYGRQVTSATQGGNFQALVNQAIQAAGPARGGGGWVGQASAPIGGAGFAQELLRRRGAPAPAPAPAGAPGGAPGGPIPGAAVNPATRAGTMGGANANYTPETLAAAGIAPLFTKTTADAGGGAEIPQWAKDLAAKFNLTATDHPDVTLHGGEGQMGSWAMDFSGKPEDQDRFAQFIMDHLGPQTLQLIHQSTITGKKYGIAGGQVVGVPGAPEYYTSAGGTYADESTMVHWATDQPPVLPGINAPEGPATTRAGSIGGSGGSAEAYDDDWGNLGAAGGAGAGLLGGYLGYRLLRALLGGRGGTGAPPGGRAGRTSGGLTRLGLLGEQGTQPVMSLAEARAGLGLPELPTGNIPGIPSAGIDGTGGLRYGAFANETLPPLQGPIVPWNRGPGWVRNVPGPGRPFYGQFNPRLGPLQGPLLPPNWGPELGPIGSPFQQLNQARYIPSILGRGGPPDMGQYVEPGPRGIPNYFAVRQPPLSPELSRLPVQGPAIPPEMGGNFVSGGMPYDGWRYPPTPRNTGLGPQFRLPRPNPFPTGGDLPLGGGSRLLSGLGRALSILGPVGDVAALGFMVHGDIQDERAVQQLMATGLSRDQATRQVQGIPQVGSPEYLRSNFENLPIPNEQIRSTFSGVTPDQAREIFGGQIPSQVSAAMSGQPGWQPGAAPPQAPPAVSPPPAQVQGRQPSNAGQFRGIDPNQLRGPIAPAGPGPTRGLTGTDRFSQELINRRAAIGADTRTGLGTTAGSQPVHVTNPESMPGGRDASGWGGIKLQDQTTPLPGPGHGLAGARGTATATTGDRPPQPAPAAPTPPANPPSQTQGQQPASGVGNFASNRNAGINYDDAYNVNNLPKPLPFNAQTPGDAFMSGLSSAGNIASDAFQVFNDVIKNISDTAAIADMLVRGPANTEDIVGIIKHFQSYLTTAADISKMVGDVGGMVSGASGGMDFGAGGGIQAVAGMISAGIQAVNQSITLGIDIYHEIGKYAGFIIGDFLGGDATGPLGGNVRMLLNTRTNQLQTYSENNPLNKNTFNVPLWQRSYQTQPTPPAVQIQQNLYVGPGQTPQQNMSDQMWAATTGGGAVSVAGHS